jgi:hypothetical protein
MTRASVLDALLDVVAAALRLRLAVELGDAADVPGRLAALRASVDPLGPDVLAAVARGDCPDAPSWRPCAGCQMPTTRTRCRRCSANPTATNETEN